MNIMWEIFKIRICIEIWQIIKSTTVYNFTQNFKVEKYQKHLWQLIGVVMFYVTANTV